MDENQQNPQVTATQTGAMPGWPQGADSTTLIISGITRTGPWARFMAVVGFVGVGFMCFAGLLIMLAGGSVGSLGAGVGAAMGLFYLLLAAVYVIPLVPLSRFASEASRLRTDPSPARAAAAIEHGRAFWMRAGILTIVGLAIGLLSMAIGLFATIAAL